jgi:peptide/nickel transport system substrate-binding protein
MMTDFTSSFRLDRRSLLKGSAALAAGAIPLLGASRAFAEPKRGGHIRFGIGDGHSNDSLDPALVNNSFTDIVTHSIGSYLVEITPDNKLGPELAESWQAEPGATKWVFKLRKGVEFHNGKTVTAGDVVASFNHHRGENSKSGGKSLLASVEKISADGDNVVFELSGGNADFPYIMTHYQFAIYPAGSDGQIDWSSGGSGAYRLENFTPGVSATLKRFENYFRNDRAWFDSGEMRAILDATARSNALMAGEIDVLHDLSPVLVELLKSNTDVIVESIPSGSHVTMPMRNSINPFGNNDVRTALKYAIDRQALIDTIMKGQATVGNDHPVGRNMPYWADLPQRQYDADKAKHHLKKAGMESLQVELFGSEAAFAGATDACLLFAEQARKAGIDIKVNKAPADGYWSNVWNKEGFCITLWVARPTPDMIFSLAYASGVDWNESQFSNETFDKLLVAARSELDEAKRADMYREMQLIVSDQGNTIIPFFQNHVFARSAKVDHGAIASNAPIDGNRAMERWWFKS